VWAIGSKVKQFTHPERLPSRLAKKSSALWSAVTWDRIHCADPAALSFLCKQAGPGPGQGKRRLVAALQKSAQYLRVAHG
jgi:hypothetical protein